MRLFLSLCFSFSLFLVTAAAQAAPVGTERYELKNRSFCKLDPAARPPFWPIGWVKRETQNASQITAVPVAKVPILDENSFKVTSIMLGSPSLAIINGRTYSEGEFIRIPKSSPMAGARILVRRIHDGLVQLQAGTQQLPVKLTRPEPGAKKYEEELLNEDR